MSPLSDIIKRALIQMNRGMGTLERMGFVTYRDIVTWREPKYRQKILYGQEGHNRIGELIAHNKPLMIARLGAT